MTWFTLSVYNQDDELTPKFSDYILLLQFIRHRTEEEKMEILLNSLVDYVNNYFFNKLYFISGNRIKKNLN
jgi:hypothetical protein